MSNVTTFLKNKITKLKMYSTQLKRLKMINTSLATESRIVTMLQDFTEELLKAVEADEKQNETLPSEHEGQK